MVSFWNSLTSSVSSVGHFIGSTVHQGYSDINSIIHSGINTVDDVAKTGFGTVNNAVNQVAGLGKNAENRIGGAIQGAESAITLPLILIAGGLAFFLVSKNAGKAIEIGGQIAQKKL